MVTELRALNARSLYAQSAQQVISKFGTGAGDSRRGPRVWRLRTHFARGWVNTKIARAAIISTTNMAAPEVVDVLPSPPHHIKHLNFGGTY